MSSSSTKPKTEALTFPADPLAILSMQNLDKHFAPPSPEADPTEKNTEKITYPHTEILTEDHTETLAELHPPAHTSRRKGVKAAAPPSGSASVRQRIVEDLHKEPVVRKTIDIPASLNERLQEYCAAKRIKTERRVFLVLLENFLEEEGF